MLSQLVFSAVVASCCPQEGAVVDLGPFEELPSGWTYLTHAQVDLWTGALHDETSGAYVDFSSGFDLDPGGIWGSEPDDVVTRGTLGSTPYILTKVQRPRERLVQEVEREFGEPIENFPTLVRSLPPVGCPLIQIVYQPLHTDVIWKLKSAVCNSRQEERVLDLFLQKVRIRFDKVGHANSERPRRLSERQYEDLEDGTQFLQIRRVCGPPASSFRVGENGFAVLYFVDQTHVEYARTATLTFDNAHTLVRKEIEARTPQ